MIYGNLIHLSYNMWCDWDNPVHQGKHIVAKPYLRFDEPLWNELLGAMKQGGLNMVVIDVGDAVQFESHPEIALKDAWPREKLRDELKKCRDMGLEPIPKLNFSTCHDEWLGPYARMVSSAKYYDVCRDLIEETIDLFDKPRLFHLGMDEETEEHQRLYEHAVIRQHALWWRDLEFFVDAVQKKGSRAWVWSDYVWDHPERFWERMPKQVLQSNWYYGDAFGDDVKAVRAYRELEDHAYDQVPTLSNWSNDRNIAGTVEYCRRHIKPERLKGFLLAPWHPTLPDKRDAHLSAIAQFAKAIAAPG